MVGILFSPDANFNTSTHTQKKSAKDPGNMMPKTDDSSLGSNKKGGTGEMSHD